MTRYRVLALDGGGVRGIVTAVWLRRLEEELGSPLRRHFDLIAGTSTGSILACALALGRSAASIVELYQRKAASIFPQGPKPRGGHPRSQQRNKQRGVLVPSYDGKGLARVLREEFKDQQGGDLLFGQLHPTTSLMVISYDTLTRTPVIFKNSNPTHAKLPAYEVIKASCSAPIYFPAHVTAIGSEPHALIDGGVVANNPSLCAITEALTAHTRAELLVASFGTGRSSTPISAKDAQSWGLLGWSNYIVDVLMDGPMDIMELMAGQLIPPERYFRFQATLSAELDSVDNPDPDYLDRLIKEANAYLKQLKVETRLKRLAGALTAS